MGRVILCGTKVRVSWFFEKKGGDAPVLDLLRTEEKRESSSAEFANNRNQRGYPRVLPPRFNSCYGECGGSEGGPLARKPRVAKGGGKPKLCSINEGRQLRSKRVFNGIQARFVCWQQWMPNVRLYRESLDKVESYPFRNRMHELLVSIFCLLKVLGERTFND